MPRAGKTAAAPTLRIELVADEPGSRVPRTEAQPTTLSSNCPIVGFVHVEVTELYFSIVRI